MSNISSWIRRRSGLLAVAALLFPVVAAAPAAHADIKVIQELSGGGDEAVLEKETGKDVYKLQLTIATYFKGEKFRQDSPNLNVFYIYDCAKDKFYTINKADQTYSVRKLDDVMKDTRRGIAPLKFDGGAETADDGGSRTIAGKPAKNYAVKVALRLKDEQRNQFVGGMDIEGEHWVTNAYKLPSTCANMKRVAYFPGILLIHALLTPLEEKLPKMSGVPLDYTLVVTRGAGHQLEIRSEVSSISNKPLSDSLFAVPKGYRLVDKVIEDKLGVKD
jgi:hypothetical protein